MTEKETLSYIESLKPLGCHPGLSCISELCRRLGDPQDDLKFIHIAGTNGKGSILAMLSETLTACGYKTGRYISPTISEYRERFQINGRMISKKLLCEYVEKLKFQCEEMVQAGFSHPTPFEFETALAFFYFKEKKCDVVVLETGLGGTEDATNIIKTPLVSVISSISMDHMDFLGSSLSQIARNKAGIIKEGVPVVSGVQKQEALEEIERACQEKNARLFLTNTDKKKLLSGTDKGIRFSYKHYKKMKLSLMGVYQLENAAVALETIDCLRNNGNFSLPEEKIRLAFERVSWPARFEKIAGKPDFYIDGAHNEGAVGALVQTIEFYFTNRKIIYIMGVLKDKEYDRMIQLSYPYADSIITVKTPDHERALEAYELAKAVSVCHKKVTAADSLEEAVEMAYLMAGRDGVIIAFGSLSYLGELTAIVKKGKWTRRDSHGK